MAGAYDIENTKKFVKNTCEGINALGDVFADGKVDYKDIANAVPLAIVATQFTGVDYSQGILEIADIDPEEMAELLQVVKDTVKLPHMPKAEVILEVILRRGAKIFEHAYGLVKESLGAFDEISAIAVG